MNLSRDHTYLRVAVLPHDVIERLKQKYSSGIEYTVNYQVLEDIKEINDWLAQEMPGKEDIATEWILRCLQRGAGWYEKKDPLAPVTEAYGFSDMVNEVRFYFDHFKEPMYKDAIQEWSDEYGIKINPKNVMEFTLYNLQSIKRTYEEMEEAGQVNTLPDELPEGAQLVYDDGAHQIVEVTEISAACQLGRLTQWCTREEPAAGVYLEDGPLYILYRNRERYAQLHLGGNRARPDEMQLKNLRNRSLKLDDDTRALLIKSGFMDRILDVFDRSTSYVEDGKLAYWIGDKENSYFRKKFINSPRLAYLYASQILKGKRFPEGEPAIARDPRTALNYSMYVLQSRFHAGEPALRQSRLWDEYLDMMKYMDPEGWKELTKETSGNPQT